MTAGKYTAGLDSSAPSMTRLGASAAGASHRDPRAIDVRQRQHEIESPACCFQGLQAHNALQVRLSTRTEEAPVSPSVQFRSLFGKPMCKLIGDLRVVGIANHVIVKDHHIPCAPIAQPAPAADSDPPIQTSPPLT